MENQDILCHFSPSLSLSLFLPLLLSPLLYLALYLSVCLSRSQSTMSHVTDLSTASIYISFSFALALFLLAMLFIRFMASNPRHKDTLYCFALYLLLLPLHRLLLPFLSSSSSSSCLFIQLKQCNPSVLMQHRVNCQKPSGGLSPALQYSTKSNLAGVTEVRLEISHFSTGQILFMLMASQFWPRKLEQEEAWLANPPLEVVSFCITHYALLFLLFFIQVYH